MKNKYTPILELQNKSFFPQKISGFKTENQTLLFVILTPVQKQNREKGINWIPCWITGNVIRAAATLVSACHDEVKRLHKEVPE